MFCFHVDAVKYFAGCALTEFRMDDELVFTDDLGLKILALHE